MGRLQDLFAELGRRREAALAAYVMAGYPDWPRYEAAAGALARGGADVVELGFPFSDPLADGPVIQAAAEASLRGGASLPRYLRSARRLREAHPGTPLVMMTYANVAHSRGYGRLAREAAAAGIDAVILADLPPEEAAEHRAACARAGAGTVFLASPNAPPARVREIAAASTGFVYLVPVYGTTGARGRPGPAELRAVRSARRAAAGLAPVGVGFGVSSPRDVAAYARAGADAVIVGSAVVSALGRLPPGGAAAGMGRLARSLKAATRRR